MLKEQIRKVTIKEFAKDGDDKKLSIIDIKAAIAEQNIGISDLYSKQDLSVDTSVVGMISDARLKVKQEYVNEAVVLKKNNVSLQAFKDKTETVTLVDSSKALADKDEKTIAYIRARLSTGKGVDLTGDLTQEQRQEKVTNAIEEELTLIKEQGITFKVKADDANPDPNYFDDKDKDVVDYTKPENNPLIPSDKETTKAKA